MTLLIGLLFPGAAFAAEDPSRCYRTFEIGLNTRSVAKDLVQVQTISSDLYREIKKRVRCSFNERDLSFTKAATELRNRRLDIYAFVFASEDWQPFTNHTEIYSVRRLLLVSNKFYKPNEKPEYYLRNKKINFAVISGGVFFTSSTEIDLLNRDKRTVYVPYPDGVLDLLNAGSVSAAFTSPTYYLNYKNRAALDKKSHVIIDDQRPMTLGLFYSKERVSKSERKMFENAIQDMKKDGTIRRVLEKYVPPDELMKYYLF